MAQNLWDENEARKLHGLDQVVYRSNLLGRDRSVANWGGGNTSMKSMEKDFRGHEVRVLWVKGSGSDLATITRAGFTGLRLEDVLPLETRDAMTDEEMTAYLAHCALAPNMPRSSIETLMHAFVPFDHIDHTHPDNIISLATALNGENIARTIFGGEAAWLAYIRPGFKLAKDIAQALRERPKLRAVIMGRHGLVTWGNTSKECYDHTLEFINRAGEYIEDKAKGRARFGGVQVEPLAEEARRELLLKVLPPLRGALSKRQRMILRVDDTPEARQFAGGATSKSLALTGAACPDHLVHTKHWPLWADFPSTQNVDALIQMLPHKVEAYAANYEKYFAENRQPNDVMDDPAPRVVLIPGVGMINTGKDARFADISAQLYLRAINVMRGTDAMDRYVSLTPAEAYGVEYWPLERYKLTLQPPENELARHVAFITGAASGIGRAIAQGYAAEGAHVVLADINTEGAEKVANDISHQCGFRRALAVHCDVTDEGSVAKAFAETVLAYGGVDIVVSNAGLATANKVEDTSLAEWNKTMGVLVTGYFLVAREAMRVMKAQGIGGNILFIGSKNSLAPGKNAGAYSAAKAAELHFARVLAEEGGAFGVRVNSICPDAVIQGSGIWSGEWREARAKAHGIKPEEIEEYYRQRCTLRVNVYPEDIAKAALFLASPRASKTTGAVLTVDGGIPGAYVR